MGVVRYKIWSDLWANKGRTLQVVLIIAMGAFAIGMIITTRNLLIPAMEDIWQAANPAMINLGVNPRVDDDMIMALKGIEGIENVEGVASTAIEWRLSPDDQWSAANLTARNDYKKQHYTVVSLLSGEWPKEKAFAIGQGTDVAYGIEEGSQVYIRVDDREHVVKISGIIYGPALQPPSFGGPAQFYTTRDRLGDLTGDRDFNRIMARAPEYDEATLTGIADKMQRKLEKQGVESGGASPPAGSRVTDPNKHFFQDPMDALFFILGVMSILTLILGLFLVYNTIDAIVSQQVDQIGIMKAIGAKTNQILLIYLLNIFAYGFLALIIAIPLGVTGGWFLNLYLLDTFNAEPGPFIIDRYAIMAQVTIAVLAPLLASLFPIFFGSRITVREAISTYGLNVKSSFIERGLAKMERVSRMVLLTISNTFRNKKRVFLTQISLILSGMIFMMVLGVWDSTVYTFDDLVSSILKFNVNLAFKDPERIEQVEALTLAHPDVKAVEMWSIDGDSIRPDGQPESDDDESVGLFGVPLPTTLYGPQMRGGRWLEPDDTYAVVLNEKLAEDVGVGVGDWVTVKHGIKGESTWQVVGLLFDPITTNSAHTPRETMLREFNSVGKATTIWIQTVRSDPDGEEAAAHNLRDYYDQFQLDLSPGSFFGQNVTASGISANILGQFGMIITLLAVVAAIIGLVGGIALSGALSLNVLERRREIGVMRAVGASSGTIARLFIGEGLMLGWLSWAIALPLSIPAARIMTLALSEAFGTDIVYKYTPTGALYWLAIITVLSILASLLPARGAMRVSVRESLAYQ